MGITKSAAKYLIRDHARDPFEPPLLILGRQHVYTTLGEVTSELRSLGATVYPLPESVPALTDMPDWDFGKDSGYISDSALFWTIAGMQAAHLDCSAYENAEYIRDLNKPVDKSLRGKFGTILDGGTIEHVFDVRSCLANITGMLKPGGRVIHITQASNWINHGFYQFSPVFFFDYYGANGFQKMACHLADQGSGNINRSKWKWYGFPRPNAPSLMLSSHVGIFFSARSGGGSREEVIPNQGCFSDDPIFGIPTAPSTYRRVIPKGLSSFARRLYWAFSPDDVF